MFHLTYTMMHGNTKLKNGNEHLGLGNNTEFAQQVKGYHFLRYALLHGVSKFVSQLVRALPSVN